MIVAVMIMVAMHCEHDDHGHCANRRTSEHRGLHDAKRVVITRSSLLNATKHGYDHR